MKELKKRSPALRAAADKRRVHSILAVKGISPGKLIRIEPADFAKLDVDATYQRGETNFVSQIIQALSRGGVVLDPVTLCKRTSWGGGGDKYWIIDGHQRVCAFQASGIGFNAMVHESASLEAERTFFLSMNTRRAMTAGLIVKSWPGPAGKIVVQANASPEHPLYERVGLEQGMNRSRIAGLTCVRGALMAATGVEPNGGVNVLLPRLDVALGVDLKRVRAEHFLRMLGRVFPKGKVNDNVAVAFAHVAFIRWEQAKANLEMPSLKVIERLQKIKWEMEVPVLVRKYRPVVEGIITRHWK